MWFSAPKERKKQTNRPRIWASLQADCSPLAGMSITSNAAAEPVCWGLSVQDRLFTPKKKKKVSLENRVFVCKNTMTICQQVRLAHRKSYKPKIFDHELSNLNLFWESNGHVPGSCTAAVWHEARPAPGKYVGFGRA